MMRRTDHRSEGSVSERVDAFGQPTATTAHSPYDPLNRFVNPTFEPAQLDLSDPEWVAFFARMAAPGMMLVEFRALSTRPNVALLEGALRDVGLGLWISHRLWTGSLQVHWHYVAEGDDIRAQRPAAASADEFIDHQLQLIEQRVRRAHLYPCTPWSDL